MMARTAVEQWSDIAAETETGVNRRVASITGHDAGCDCEDCGEYRKAGMLPAWQRKWAAEGRESAEEERATAEAERPRKVLQDTLAQRAEIKDARRGARTRRAAALHVAAELARNPRRTGGETGEMEEALVKAAQLEAADRQLQKRQKLLTGRAAELRVISEPRVYGPTSPYSYYLDVAARACEQIDPTARGAALQRLAQYGRELAAEVDRDSTEGRRALRCVREQTRAVVDQSGRVVDARSQREHEDRYHAELRAVGTDGGASATAPGEASAFVSPSFLDDRWVPYRGRTRAFTEQCEKAPMPEWGMEVYAPRFTSEAKTATQSDNAAVTESSPASGLEGAKVETVSGMVIISQQIHDRGLTGGGAFDIALAKQLRQSLNEQINLYVLAQAIANGESVAGSNTAFSEAEGGKFLKSLYKDIAVAREKLTDTAGTRLRPTCFFSTSDFYSYTTRQTDSQERPILTPQWAPGFPIASGADGGPQGDEPHPRWARFSGTVLPGGVLWFEDDCAPVVGTGSRTSLVVSAPEDAVMVLESEQPILSVWEQTDATHLQTVVNLRAYIAAITKHPSGTAVISVNSYLTTLV